MGNPGELFKGLTTSNISQLDSSCQGSNISEVTENPGWTVAVEEVTFWEISHENSQKKPMGKF